MEFLARLMLVCLLFGGNVPAQDEAASLDGQAVRLDITGAIGPATSDYVVRGLEKARERGAPFVILRMDTPGGLDSSMRSIIKAILASPIPVVGWVHPQGARAASAGTYILYAAHVAAMAPATNLGAATPVSIGPSAPAPAGGGDEGGKADKEGGDKENAPAMPADPKMRKAVNDAVAYIRGLAKMRGRNAEWAEDAVRRGVSLEADAAVEKNVVDFIAADTRELLKRLDGRTVELGQTQYTFDTAGVGVVASAPDWRSRLLSVITDPNIAYILMLIGIYGLVLEFSNPGAIVPGTVGAIALLLALYALQVLPVNFAGLGLMLLGAALMVGEVFAPSFGALGIGGLVAFTIGSIILIDTDAPGFGISPALIGGVALFSGTLFMFLLATVVKSRNRPVVSGQEEMIGAPAVVLVDFEGEGMVHAHGERWRATSDVPLHKGQHVRIVSMDGLCLKVEPQEKQGE